MIRVQTDFLNWKQNFQKPFRLKENRIPVQFRVLAVSPWLILIGQK